MARPARQVGSPPSRPLAPLGRRWQESWVARLPRFSALRPFGARYAFCRLGFSFGVGYDVPFLWVARRGAPPPLPPPRPLSRIRHPLVQYKGISTRLFTTPTFISTGLPIFIRTCNSSDSGKRSFLQLPSWPQEEEAQCGLLGSRTVPHTYSQRISTPPASTFIRRVISTGPLSAFKSSRTHRSPSSALISSDSFPAVDRGTVSSSGADSLSCAPLSGAASLPASAKRSRRSFLSPVMVSSHQLRESPHNRAPRP